MTLIAVQKTEPQPRVTARLNAEATGRAEAQAQEAEAGRKFREQASAKRRLQISLGILSLVIVVAIYWIITALPSSNPALLPPPGVIVRGFVNGILDGSLFEATQASLGRVAAGYVIGCAVAIVVGSIRGWYRIVGYLLDPVVDAMRPVPALAYIPLVILWFGIGEGARILVIAFASFLSCIVSVTAGMKEVPIVYADAARTLGASERMVFLRVAIPSALPYIFAGLRVSLGAAWGTLVAAELIAAQSGLGYLLQAGQAFFRSELVIIALVIIGLIGYLMDAFLKALQTRLLRWSSRSG